jgi:hypothetical protein
MPSTPPAYPQVIWRNLASFRVLKSCIFAVQRDFCAWFDSRQLHENPRQNYKWIGHPLPVKIPVKIWGVAAGPSHRSGTRTRMDGSRYTAVLYVHNGKQTSSSLTTFRGSALPGCMQPTWTARRMLKTP